MIGIDMTGAREMTRRVLAIVATVTLLGCGGEEAPAMPEARPADFEITVIMLLGNARTIEIAAGHGEDKTREPEGTVNRKAFQPTPAELDKLYAGLRAIKYERIRSEPHRRGSNISGRTIRIGWNRHSKVVEQPAREADAEALANWLGGLFSYVRDKTR